MEGIKLIGFVLALSLAALVPSFEAHIGEFDEYWKKRAEEAQKDALEAYHPDPQNVTAHFNSRVHRWSTLCIDSLDC